MGGRVRLKLLWPKTIAVLGAAATAGFLPALRVVKLGAASRGIAFPKMVTAVPRKEEYARTSLMQAALIRFPPLLRGRSTHSASYIQARRRLQATNREDERKFRSDMTIE